MTKQATAVVEALNQDIISNFDWLQFDAEVLSGDKLEIVASHDRTYVINYDITLTGVTYISGHLNWHWDDDEPIVVEILGIEQLMSGMPIVQDDCFIIRFRNVDLGIHPFTVMAKTIEFSDTLLDAMTFHPI